MIMQQNKILPFLFLQLDLANQIVSMNECACLGLSLNISKKVKQGMNEQYEVFSLKSMPDKFV